MTPWKFRRRSFMKKLKTLHQPTTRIFGGLAAILLMMAFWQAGKSAAAGTLSVYVVNYPLKYCAERIGAEHVNAVFPAPAEVDPAYWIPDTATIADYQQADLILLNGAGYAGWVGKVSLPRSKLVNNSRDFRDHYITVEDAVSHRPGGAHAHEGAAFTTWIDFKLATRQAKAIADAFGRKVPSLQQTFQKNYSALERELLEIDQKIKESGRFSGHAREGGHPVYSGGSFTAAYYGLFNGIIKK